MSAVLGGKAPVKDFRRRPAAGKSNSVEEWAAYDRMRFSMDAEPTKDELVATTPEDFQTDSLRFDGLRGDASRHLKKEELRAKVEELAPAPRDRGTLDLLVARTVHYGREILKQAVFTPEHGLHGDRWGAQRKFGPEFQIAVTRTDFARLIANGQPLELHGDNVFLSLDLSDENLPPGSLVRMGGALFEVTPQAHNGCKKWVQRFGLAPMRLNLAPDFRHHHLRGIYFRVVTAGRACVGDPVIVERRGAS